MRPIPTRRGVLVVAALAACLAASVAVRTKAQAPAATTNAPPAQLPVWWLLHHWQADPVPGADATVHLTRDLLVRLGTGEAGVKDLVLSDDFKVEGSRLDLISFLSLVKTPDGQFSIVTP